MYKSSGGGSAPRGQEGSGVQTAAGRNPKDQPPMRNGSEQLPDGATSTHFETVAGRPEPKPAGHVPGSEILTGHISPSEGSTPATINVSANRVKRIQP